MQEPQSLQYVEGQETRPGERRRSKICIKREKTKSYPTLHLEATRSSLSTRALKLAALGANKGLGMRAWGARRAKVLDGLTGILGAAQQDAVGPLGRDQGELVKADALSTRGNDARASRVGKAQGANSELLGLDEASIVSDGANDDGNVGLLLASHVALHARQRHGRAVHSRHEKTLQNDAVKVAVHPASQEAVHLDQKRQVNVVALGRGALLVANEAAAGDQIDTLSGMLVWNFICWGPSCGARPLQGINAPCY